ncbi:cocaine- and amphetamine-regulated transcript protein-like [Aquarana catesbeiana]|uniref:cocaine- and amphetamine-regulated transcript protein-like n=1 Tax=Aquarana catesbeiana TaxID=8400 RepID=UPI003CC94961
MSSPHRSPVLSLCLIASLLAFLAFAKTRANPRGSEKELLLELQDVLEKLQSKRGILWESKLNQMPKCLHHGDACAVKRGLRIGKLCDCPRRSVCNQFFLRCL